MRILQVNPYFTAHRGGVERRIFAVGKELSKRGHEVFAATGLHPGTAPSEDLEGVRVRRLAADLYEGGPYDPPFLTARGLAAALEGVEADVVDIHYMWSPDYTRTPKKLRKGTPVVFTLHNSFGAGEGVAGRSAYLSNSVFKFFLRNCELAVCVSEYVRRDVRGRGIRADKLRVVHSGIDPTPLGELARLRGEAPKREGPFAAFAGRLERTKGLNVLVEAAASLRVPLQFLVMGEGPDLEDLRAEAKDFGVSSRFEFLGFVPEARKRALLAQADLFVYPATFEPSGVAVLEAMDLGCPVVSTLVGGIPEVVKDAALLTPPGDPAALAGAIGEVLSAPERRQGLAAAGRARAAELSWSAAASAMEAVYAEAAGAPRA